MSNDPDFARGNGQNKKAFNVHRRRQDPILSTNKKGIEGGAKNKPTPTLLFNAKKESSGDDARIRRRKTPEHKEFPLEMEEFPELGGFRKASLQTAPKVLLKQRVKTSSENDAVSSAKSGASSRDLTVENRERSSSPSVKTLLARKDSRAATQPTVAQGKTKSEKPAEPLQQLQRTPKLDFSLKLIDDNQIFHDSVLDYFIDNSDFFVIGVVGKQSVGKSTILNGLIGKQEEDQLVYQVQCFEQQIRAEYCTSGVDVYVTSSRQIILDCQPVMSASLLEKTIQHEKKYSSEFSSTENTVEMNSLQLVSLLLNVCHVVVVVQDWFTDGNIIRLLQTAEMLKPNQSVEESFFSEYTPNIVFLHNKCMPSDFDINTIRVMQEFYLACMNKSRLLIQTGIGIANGTLPQFPDFNPENCGEPINFFMLPDFDISLEGFPNFDTLMKEFKLQLMTLPINQFTHSNLTEKGWFYFARKSWENIKKSPFYIEYSRTLS